MFLTLEKFLIFQGGNALGVIEVFNKYMRQGGDGSTVTPNLVTYNLVRLLGVLFGRDSAFSWPPWSLGTELAMPVMWVVKDSATHAPKSLIAISSQDTVSAVTASVFTLENRFLGAVRPEPKMLSRPKKSTA